MATLEFTKYPNTINKVDEITIEWSAISYMPLIHVDELLITKYIDNKQVRGGYASRINVGKYGAKYNVSIKIINKLVQNMFKDNPLIVEIRIGQLHPGLAMFPDTFAGLLYELKGDSYMLTKVVYDL